MLDHVFNTVAGVVPDSAAGYTAGPKLDDEWDSLTSIPSRSSVTAVPAATHPGLDARCKT